jgi:anaerobic selenocysteine-containing dehydrogenase
MRRRFIAPLTAATAAMAAASAIALPAAAQAATVAPAASAAKIATVSAAACGWTDPLKSNSYNGVQYWLSYNTCDRTVRGAMIIRSGSSDWHLWVYNENTGGSEDISSNVHNTTIYTAAIADAGTRSRVCVQPITPGTGKPTGGKSCTGYY